MKLELLWSRVTLYVLTFLFIANLPTPLFAQTAAGSVRGMVLGTNDQPSAGASVLIRNSRTNFSAGTSTDSTGGFSFARVPVSGAYTLSISAVGYETQTLSNVTVKEGENPALQISLKGNVANLEQVVVVGYGTQRKSDVTGSIASVNTKELKSLPVANVGEAMQGRAAGVQVLSSGSPGSNVTFRIRGAGTINNSDPLIVIDGVPTDIPLNAINQDDIASIEILKDASSAAIYGSRGANGVVLITTKKGTAGQNHLEFKVFGGQQKATNIVKMLDASQFASLHNEMMANNGRAQNPAFSNPDTLGKGTDWLGALFRPASMQSYSLSYSGGNANSSYYVSGGVFDQQGIVINTSYRRYTLQFNSDSKVFNWIKFGNNLTLNHDVKKNGSYDIRNTMAALPTQPINNADGTYAGPVGQPEFVGDIRNPIGTATINTNETKGYNILGNLYTEVTLMKGLKFKTTGGVQASFWDTRNFAPKYNWQPIPVPDTYVGESFNKSLTFLWDNYFTYERNFGSAHRLNIVAGTSAQNNRFDYMNGSKVDYANDNVIQLNNGTSQPTVAGSASEWALMSYIGRVNYGFRNKYLVTATVRRDGSSRFGPANKYGTFPSGSIAWRISKEDFFKNVTLVNDLKLRAGYGVTGNQNIGNYSFASQLSTGQYVFNGTPVSATVPVVLPNPAVRWEQVEQANIAVDVSLLNNRISVTIDAYLKNTNDMLVPQSVPITTGYSDIYVPSINAGKVQNKGVEFTINTENTKGAFEWNTNFNISYNQNKVVSLNDTTPLLTGSIGLSQNLAIQSAGHPVNSFYGFMANGIFQTDKEVADYAVQVPGADPFNRTSPGDVKFKDRNNDGIIDDRDRGYLGDPNSSYIFGMNNSFSYKGFDLSVFLQGVSGNKVFNANRVYQEGMAVAQNQTTQVLNRWTGPGTSNVIPRAIFNDPNKNTRVSDRFLEDGSYLRIKNITLGYNLPRNILRGAKMSSARLYVSCQNLATFTHYTGFDPEVGSNGIDLNVYPVTRTLSAGINVIF